MCETVYLISNPRKADSLLVAVEYGWVVLGKYTRGGRRSHPYWACFVCSTDCQEGEELRVQISFVSGHAISLCWGLGAQLVGKPGCG